MIRLLLISFLYFFLPQLELYGVTFEDFRKEMEGAKKEGPIAEIEVAKKYLKLNQSKAKAIDIYGHHILARAYANLGDGKKTIDLATKGVELGAKDVSQEHYLGLLTSKSIGLHLENSLGEAESFITDVINNWPETALPRELAIAYFTRGRIRVDQDKHEDAIEDFRKSYKIVENTNDPQMETTILIDLANSLNMIGDLKNALKHLRTAASMSYLENNLFAKAVVYIHWQISLLLLKGLRKPKKLLKL